MDRERVQRVAARVEVEMYGNKEFDEFPPTLLKCVVVSLHHRRKSITKGTSCEVVSQQKHGHFDSTNLPTSDNKLLAVTTPTTGYVHFTAEPLPDLLRLSSRLQGRLGTISNHYLVV